MNKILNKISLIALFLIPSLSLSSDFLDPKPGLLDSVSSIGHAFSGNNLLEESGNNNFISNFNKIPVNPMLIPSAETILHGFDKYIAILWRYMQSLPEEARKKLVLFINSLQEKSKPIEVPIFNGKVIPNTNSSTVNLPESTLPNRSSISSNPDFLIINDYNRSDLSESWDNFSGALKSATAKGLDYSVKGANLVKDSIPYMYENPGKTTFYIFLVIIAAKVVKRIIPKMIDGVADTIANGICKTFGKAGSAIGKLIGNKKKNDDDDEDKPKKRKTQKGNQKVTLTPGPNVRFERN